MAVNIKSSEADRLAREVAALAGESLTVAVTTALAERLARLRRQSRNGREAEILAIFARGAGAPRLDPRQADEILGYGPDGTFD